MNAFLRFFTEMDARTARAWWISTLAFGIVGLALTAGVFFVDFDQGALAQWLGAIRRAWWAPGAVTALFVVLAFVGAPQIALIAATAAVFGPGEGAIMSWIATMISAVVGFLIGRAAGAATLERLEGRLIERLRRAVAQNGFLAAAIIRVVPSGPFILVNMALGATGMRASWFVGGTGLGIVPKIAFIAFAGHGIAQLFDRRNLDALAFFVIAAAIWASIVFIVRPMAKKGRDDGQG
ncbi:MAG: VTT domain-containing protein [Pseudomonadota bacterium]